MPQWPTYMTSDKMRRNEQLNTMLQNSRASRYGASSGGSGPRPLLRRFGRERDPTSGSESYYDRGSFYIPPGTHSIPSVSSVAPSSSPFRMSRRPTPRPVPTPTSLAFGNRPSSYLGPIFSSDEEDEVIDFVHDTPTSYSPFLLPPIHESGFVEFQGLDKFEEMVALFPEVPLEAQKRIFHMGNDIIDSFETRLDRYQNKCLIDSVPDCVAVFTKKDRTGQRWLMVFKEDSTRTVVKFNRLLTHNLVANKSDGGKAVEIEAAFHGVGYVGGGGGSSFSDSNYTLNFMTEDEGRRFYDLLQECAATAWNHREVSQEQRIKNIFQALDATTQNPPPTRGPFTVSRRERAETKGREDGTNKVPTSSISQRRTSHMADFDDHWREHNGSGDQHPSTVQLPPPRQPSRSRNSNKPAALKKSWSTTSASTTTSASQILNGGGDGSHSLLFPHMKPSGLLQNMRIMEDEGNPSLPVPQFLKVFQKKEKRSNKETEEGPQLPGTLIFQGFATVYLKTELDYIEFGRGILTILDHKDAALNELRLVDKDRREILQQYIYKWNNAMKIHDMDSEHEHDEHEEEEDTPICLWSGAACFTQQAEGVPSRRDFKARLKNPSEAEDFVQAFIRSVEKANDEAIRKRHIQWYLQAKRDYGMPSSTSS